MMKRILTLLVLVAAVGYTASAQRIAVIDIQEILSNMKEYSSAEKQLDDLAAEWRQEVSIEYDKIKSLYNKYQAEQVLLSDADKKKREDELFDERVAKSIVEERRKIEEKLKLKIAEEQGAQMDALQKELNDKSAQVSELNKTKAEVERLKRGPPFMVQPTTATRREAHGKTQSGVN